MFGAIIVPEQKLPREPTMVTTLRPTPSALGAPPPTIAQAGAAAASVNAIARGKRRGERALIGGDQPCRAAVVNRSRACGGWSRSQPMLLDGHRKKPLTCQTTST